ncbi:MAG: DUF4097 family beta strand repeat-containing protein [Bdellovibrio sp.]
MKKLKKFLLGLVALFLILTGFFILTVGYFFTYPDKFFGIVHHITDRVFEGQKFEENEEFFLQGINTLFLTADNMKLSLRTYTGSTLKVVIQGKVPQFEQGPFVIQTLESDKLHLEFHEPMASSWFHMNVNGEEVSQKSNVQLEAMIYVPEAFKGQLDIKTQSGDVLLSLSRQLFYELDLQSVSGKIRNNFEQKANVGISPQSVGHVKVQTESGSISVEAF